MDPPWGAPDLELSCPHCFIFHQYPAGYPYIQLDCTLFALSRKPAWHSLAPININHWSMADPIPSKSNNAEPTPHTHRLNLQTGSTVHYKSSKRHQQKECGWKRTPDGYFGQFTNLLFSIYSIKYIVTPLHKMIINVIHFICALYPKSM